MTTKHTLSAEDSAQSRTILIDDNARIALGYLRQAYLCAQNAGTDLWDFALEIGWLFATGLTINHLRWLVAKRYAEHGQESSVYGDPHRTFRRGDGFYFDHTTSVVLTPTGAAFVAHVMKEPVVSLQSIPLIEASLIAGGETAVLIKGFLAGNHRNGTTHVAVKPCWNSTQRELSLNGTIIKQYRVPAKNQEMILSAFEEEGWPEHVDDPLPVSAGIDPQTRLHDAINRLNGRQTHRLLRFSGNGAGTGIFWELRQTVALYQSHLSASDKGDTLPLSSRACPRPQCGVKSHRPQATKCN